MREKNDPVKLQENSMTEFKKNRDVDIL